MHQQQFSLFSILCCIHALSVWLSAACLSSQIFDINSYMYYWGITGQLRASRRMHKGKI